MIISSLRREVRQLGTVVFLILAAVLSVRRAQASPVRVTPAPAASSDKAALPANTILYVRLETAVSTASSKIHNPVRARVVRQALVGDSVVIPLGTVLEGEIVKVSKSPDPGTPALMKFQFTKIELPGEKAAPIFCHLLKVENARETVLSDGTIQGVKGTQLPSSYLDTALGRLAQSLPSLSSTIQDIGKQQIGAPDTAIAYPVGTDLEVVLDKPLECGKTYPQAAATALPTQTVASIEQLLKTAPQRSETQAGVPGDPLNLIIIGNEQGIAAAFKKAGWVVPAKKENNSIWKTAQAMIKDLGYAAAPISNLYLYHRPQDMAFEKMLNTFNMRHHLRLWRSGVKTADGAEIWLGAAVHDTGIDIHPGVVSHATSPDLDSERAKVGADLLATGMVNAEALVTRPNPLTKGFTGTGGAWHTDGKLLTIVLKP